MILFRGEEIKKLYRPCNVSQFPHQIYLVQHQLHHLLMRFEVSTANSFG